MAMYNNNWRMNWAPYDESSFGYTRPNLGGSGFSTFLPQNTNLGGFGNLNSSLDPNAMGAAQAQLQGMRPGGPQGQRMNWGANIPTFQFGLNALGTLGGLYLGHEAMQAGWDNFRLTRDMAHRNYDRQIDTYNQAMAARVRGLEAPGMRTQEQIDEEIRRNSLPNRKK